MVDSIDTARGYGAIVRSSGGFSKSGARQDPHMQDENRRCPRGMIADWLPYISYKSNQWHLKLARSHEFQARKDYTLRVLLLK